MDIDNLPIELNEKQSLELAYGRDLYWILKKLQSQVSVLVECEKQIIPFLYMHLRDNLKQNGIQVEYLDGRTSPEQSDSREQGGGSVLKNMISQIRYWVRNSTEQKVLVLPHLDLLVSSNESGMLPMEGREILPLLYENPRVVLLSFQDPNFTMNKVIENLFPARRKLIGIDRSVLSRIVLQREARKFPQGFQIQGLYQYLSGLNPVRIRQILSRLEGVDFPESVEEVIRQIREMSLDSEMEVPRVDMDEDIGGYENVKKKLSEDILSILTYRVSLEDEKELAQIDSIIPKGIIFHGPPGTGKTFFAKAMATALNATILIVNGPELKSMWVGQSEENLRKIFFKARQSAPSIIVFDELDSFASSRASEHSHNVSHSMVNQLLTEMDGFRKEELVFVVGTTNFVSSLDAALLRPGRFEMKIHIPFPEEKDRLEILKIYKKKMNLPLSDEQVDYLAKKCGEMNDPMTGSPFTGDHIYSVMRYLKRTQIRTRKTSFERQDLYQALRGGESRLSLNDEERRVIAYHEAGHATVALNLKDSSPVERVTIESDYTDALGYVKHSERQNKYVITKRQLLADLIVLMGGREAESIMFQDISVGSENDIYRANQVVQEMVSRYGMSEAFGVRVTTDSKVSDECMKQRDDAMGEILEQARRKARAILENKRGLLELMGETLIQEKVLERERVLELVDQYMASKAEVSGT